MIRTTGHNSAAIVLSTGKLIYHDADERIFAAFRLGGDGSEHLFSSWRGDGDLFQPDRVEDGGLERYRNPVL